MQPQVTFSIEKQMASGKSMMNIFVLCSSSAILEFVHATELPSLDLKCRRCAPRRSLRDSIP